MTELSCRAKDAEAMANAAEQFCALGFRQVLRRTRRTRKPEAFPAETTAVPAKPEDFEDVSRFLNESLLRLSPAVCRPRAIYAKTSQTVKPLSPGTKKVFPVCCILAVSRASTEIRHLAVRADCRGRGLAGELLTAYLNVTDGAKKSGMGAAGNAPAEHFYEQHGYRPDGWTSAVLQYN